MANQRRSWLARVGVVLVVSFGALLGITTPALAATDAVLESSSFDPGSVNVGSTSALKVRIKNNGTTDNKVFNVNIQSEDNGVASISGASNKQITLDKGASGNLEFTLRGQGTGGQEQKQVKVIIKEGSDVLGDETLTVKAPQQQPQYTGTISGVVNNITLNKPVQGAKVTLQDGAGKTFPAATTNSNGNYTFNGANLKITAGDIIISVVKDPLVSLETTKTVKVAAGQNMTMPAFDMQDPTAASPSAIAAASADPSASAEPTAAGIDNASDDEGLDSMTWIMIIVGGVLVALGIGAIVLLLVRRNNDDEDEEDEDDQPARGRPGPRGPQPGYRPPQPTQQYGGAGYGRGADPTMVARPGMGDAPTMMHRPDPYGSQPTQQYGGQQWTPQQQPGYGPPASGPGYGQASGGGAYGGPSSGGGGYAGPSSGAGGYAGPSSGAGGYAGPSSGAGGYGGGYGQPPGHGAGQYDEPTSYAGGAGGSGGGGGYGQSDEYGQQQGYDAGYGQQGGYGQSGQSDQYGQQGYQQDPYGQQGHSDDRRNRGDRRLDWLDD